MDNNRTERTFRGAAISRKLCFGSDSLLGAQLTAMLYSIFVTLQFNDLDIRMWLTEWLETCAVNHGKPPSDLAKWLPWSMDPKRRTQFDHRARATAARMTRRAVPGTIILPL